MLKNLIFDWSGTLVDDLDPVVATTNKTLGAYGRDPLTREEFLEKFELPAFHSAHKQKKTTY